MYLSELKLWNFRKFGKTPEQNVDDLDLESPHLKAVFNKGVNLLVGENDSGKTSIIDAIKLVLKTHSLDWIKAEEDDFYTGTNRFRIECIFRDFSDNEAKNFLEWLSIDTDVEGNTIPYLRLILDARKGEGRILPYEVKGGPDPEGKIINAEAKEYLKATYLKPLRDAKAELIARKNSRLSQILYGHPIFKDGDGHVLVRVLADANTKITDYFENETDEATNGFKILKTLKTYLTSFLKKGSPQATKFFIDNPKLKNILEILKLSLQDERSGLGTYNLLFIAAELLHLRKEDYNGLKLGLIEEVEAHLHPQAQLRVMSALENESKEGGVQLIFTTHSPNLASKIRIRNIVLCHDQGAYLLSAQHTELQDADYNFLERFLDVTKANLFFAQGVILVEGDSENILIPTIAKIIDKDLAAHGVSIVNVGSTAFLRYSRIFQRRAGNQLEIPVAVITDLDVKPDAEPEKKLAKLQSKQKYTKQFVKTFVSPSWTLEYCIALCPHLSEPIFNAIKSAGDEMAEDGYTGKKIDVDWATFKEDLSQEELAKKICELRENKAISKAIIAQHLSKFLDEKASDQGFINSLRADENIEYIIKAIEYATSNSGNR